MNVRTDMGAWRDTLWRRFGMFSRCVTVVRETTESRSSSKSANGGAVRVDMGGSSSGSMATTTVRGGERMKFYFGEPVKGSIHFSFSAFICTLIQSLFCRYGGCQ